ncbi:MAG: hypothetical protein KAI79_01775 [Bacteroidales bacterium]|nr:hypothetical protein [Bacteroidales bacterium]
MKKKRQKHNYTSELELKSLLIRLKNRKANRGDEKNNVKINKYIRLFNKINDKKYAKELNLTQKKNTLKYKIKDKVIKLSEECHIDTESYERFGQIILLMISKVLTKPNFSGYTYRDDFFSDAIHKILKYLHNFDHTKISERSGTLVNSFAYISQIIHNSVIYIINTKKKEQINIKKQVSTEIIDHNLNIKDHDHHTAQTYYHDEYVYEYEHVREIIIEDLDLIEEVSEEVEDEDSTIYYPLVDFIADLDLDDQKTIIYYPSDYRISMDEYNDLKPYLKSKLSIIRIKEPKPELPEEDIND